MHRRRVIVIVHHSYAKVKSGGKEMALLLFYLKLVIWIKTKIIKKYKDCKV